MTKGIDWSGFAQPKPEPKPKAPRRRIRQVSPKQRKKQAAANIDRDQHVMGRHGGRCVAWGISPVCQQWAVDPHELIPVGRGGPREAWNRVPICRACHRAAQGMVGGNRLKFWWPGKEDGALPKANTPGHVRCYWAEGKNPDDYPNPFTNTSSSRGTCQATNQAAGRRPKGAAGPSPGLPVPDRGPGPTGRQRGLPLG